MSKYMYGKDYAILLDKLEQESTDALMDHQVGGYHYKSCSIQPIEYIMANNLDYCEANVVKYVTRWRKKNGIEDLKKAIHYLEILIEHNEVME